MENYLIILQKKGNYYGNRYEELWLPITEEKIEQALHNLGCIPAWSDYEVLYSEFGYPEIDKIAHNSNILVLNCLARLLQEFTGTSNELCAELVYKDCKNEYDVIAHLANRPKLVVLEPYKDIVAYGKMAFYLDFWASDLCKQMSFEEYEEELYCDGGCPLWRRYIMSAMTRLGRTKYRFTPYGLVYEDLKMDCRFEKTVK